MTKRILGRVAVLLISAKLYPKEVKPVAGLPA